MLCDELTVTGRHVRLPVPIVFSCHHTHGDVCLYALLDLLGGKRRGPVVASRRWLAGRLGVSESGAAKSLGRLTKPHTSDDPATPDAPVFLISRVRGCKLTAERTTLPGVPYVDVPEWSLGDDTTGPLVSAVAWRLYAIYLWLRCPQRGTVAHPRREIAKLLRVRADRIPTLVRELTTAGLVLTHARPGRESLIMPLAKPVTPEQGERLWAAVLTPAEQAVSDAQRCADATEAAGDAACGQRPEPRPAAGTSPRPAAGTSPHPCPGTSTKDPHYGDPHYEDPAPDRAAAPCGAATPGDPAAASSVEREATGFTAFRLARERLTAAAAARRAAPPPPPQVDWTAYGADGCPWEDPAAREAHAATLLPGRPLAAVA